MDLESIKLVLKKYSLNKVDGLKFKCYPELVNGSLTEICPVCMQNDCIDFIIFKIKQRLDHNNTISIHV